MKNKHKFIWLPLMITILFGCSPPISIYEGKLIDAQLEKGKALSGSSWTLTFEDNATVLVSAFHSDVFTKGKVYTIHEFRGMWGIRKYKYAKLKNKKGDRVK